MTEDQEAIRDAVAKVCAQFPAEYWRKCDDTGNWPEEFTRAMADGGWLGIAMPEEVGGSGMGLMEASIMMQTVARSGAGFTGCSSIHLNIFGAASRSRSSARRSRSRNFCPRSSPASRRCASASPSPTRASIRPACRPGAERTNSGYVINGRKIWTTGAQRADKIILIARTTPQEKVAKPYMGLSLFYMDMKGVDAKPIPKMGRKAVECNMLYFDDIEIPKESLIGEEGQGFKYLLQGLNPERVLFAAEAIGLGFCALERATTYAKERVVFGRPSARSQGVAHPLAKCWAELSAAELLAYKAAKLYDDGLECGSRKRTPRNTSGRRIRLQRLRSSCPRAWRHGLCERVRRGALHARSHDRTYRPGEPRNDPELHQRARAGPAKELLSAS